MKNAFYPAPLVLTLIFILLQKMQIVLNISENSDCGTNYVRMSYYKILPFDLQVDMRIAPTRDGIPTIKSHKPERNIDDRELLEWFKINLVLKLNW